MFLYNVTVKVHPDIHTNWIEWMKAKHVLDVMQTGYFTSYRICKLDVTDEDDDGITYVIQYTYNNRQDLENYVANDAERLRNEVINRYQDKFIAFRTTMELVAQG